MWRMVQRAVVLTLAGAVLGLVANAVSPRGIPYRTPPKVVAPPGDYIPFAEARQLWEEGVAVFLDARSHADYMAGHIANAFSLPTDEFEARYPEVAGMLAPDSPIVAYCDGADCDLSHHLAKRLRDLGFRDVRILKNGWTEWRKAALATSTGAQP
ncbi:MAG: Thiosulfate sulfurtransferase GlpE [Verrucomicrobiae bacterium]|nr:Thiosulfate sulfurtransferase GlpE [Verrucomicrobiae bacterium]